MRRLWKPLVVTLGLVLALDQALLHTVLSDGYLGGKRIAPFDPPVFFGAQSRSLARSKALAEGRPEPLDAAPDVDFDGTLGWAPLGSGQGVFRYDAAGTRVAHTSFPALRTPGVDRVLAIGCSFTRGDEVNVLEAWPAQLDAVDDLEVANFGVGGYGLDQSCLRYERDGRALEADEVWVTILPAALDRLVNVYRPALRHWDGSVLFKPRFVLESDGSLTHVPSRATTRAELCRLVEDQERFLSATASDPFVARFPRAFAPEGSDWTHRTSLGRLGLTVHEHRARKGERLARDPAFGIVPLAARILKRLETTASERGQRLRVFVIPCQADLWTLNETGGVRYWSGVESNLAPTTPFLDATDALLDAGADTDAGLWRPGGHPSPEGHQLLAELLTSNWR